ncbi:MAG: ATP-binding cassette domain-containing protein [Actinomycetota bacterium]|nr:ATP-binding cassette domain-containing protein [Actinomycetota bacterium]
MVKTTHSLVLMPRSQRYRRLPRLVLKALGIVWSAGRRELAVITALQLFQGLGLTAQLLLGREVLESILEEGGPGSAGFVPELAALVAVTVLLSFAGAIQVEQSRVLGELVARTAFDRVLDVAGAVDLEAYESPQFFDRLQRAQVGSLTRPMQMVLALGTLITSVIALVGITVALLALQPLLVPFVVLGYAPLWLASTRNSQTLFQFVLRMTEGDRQRMYLQRVLSGRDEAKEIRAFGLGPLLRKRYDRLYDERITQLRQVARKRLSRSLVAALGTSGLTVASLGVLGYLYVEGHMSISAMGASVAALLQLGSRLGGVADGAGTLYESALFIEDYESFLALLPRLPEAKPVGDPLPRFERLRAEGLTFTYPGAAVPAVQDVSLDVRAGEVVALVGENGSGKTTLAKLLAHLYAPDAGRILWDDLDTRACDPLTVRQSIAVIFQDFVRYLLPARENIGAGRHERFDDLDAIVRAARWSGAHDFLSQLPKGYDTTLGKEFSGGLDLSIGQWQRVALARAFFRDAPFIILDEPTAALDPRAEYDLFQRIRSLFEGRSVLLISHRFSSVCSADRIYVLKQGRVVEQGRHEELMAAGGIYRELFTLQASVYLQAAPEAPATAMGDGADPPALRLAGEEAGDRPLEGPTHLAVTWTGAVLLPALAEGATREELATLVSDRFRVDRHQAVYEVDSLLGELEARGLLEQIRRARATGRNPE